MYKNIFLWILLILFPTLHYAEISQNYLSLTHECIIASKEHQNIDKNIAYKVFHTLNYKGYSGKIGDFNLSEPAHMIITFSGYRKYGFYWLDRYAHKKYPIIVKSDFENNFEIQDIERSYYFKGKIDRRTIKGLWYDKNGKELFAFYQKVED